MNRIITILILLTASYQTAARQQSEVKVTGQLSPCQISLKTHTTTTSWGVADTTGASNIRFQSNARKVTAQPRLLAEFNLTDCPEAVTATITTTTDSGNNPMVPLHGADDLHDLQLGLGILTAGPRAAEGTANEWKVGGGMNYGIWGIPGTIKSTKGLALTPGTYTGAGEITVTYQ